MELNQESAHPFELIKNLGVPKTHPDSHGSGAIIKTNKRQAFNKLRTLSKDPRMTAEHGYVVLHLNKGCFVRLPTDDNIYSLREKYLKALSTTIVKPGRSNFLCHASACRVYHAPLLTDDLVIHTSDSQSPEAKTYRPIRLNDPWSPTTQVKRKAYKANTEVVSVNGIRTTSRRQTLFDVLAYFPDPDFISPGDALLRQLIGLRPGERWAPNTWIKEFEEGFTQFVDTRTGRFSRQRVLSRLKLLNPLSESPLESLTRFYCHTIGMPTPKLQHEIVYSKTTNQPLMQGDYFGKHPRGSYFVDLAWPEYGVAIEVDGIAKYESADALRAEKFREATIRMVFPRLIRLTAKTLRDWDAFTQLMQSSLRS